MINKFFSVSRKILLNKFELASIARHKTVLGNAREIFVREFLEKILPTDIEYKTGQIVNITRNLSNQCDIILQKKNSPCLNLADNSQISFYEYVLSILEIKSSLNENAISDAKKHTERLLKLGEENQTKMRASKIYRNIEVGGGKNYSIKGIPYFIIAYRGMNISTLEEKLQKYNLLTTTYDKDENILKPYTGEPLKIQLIINLEGKYAFIDKNYFDALDIIGYNGKNRVNSKIVDYVIIQDDDILKFLYFMLNHIFLAKEYDKDMILNEYLKYSML